MSVPIDAIWEQIRTHAEGFPPQAFAFVQEGLRYTVEKIHGEDDFDDLDASRHVDGRQLSLGLRELAIKRYGRLARTVFDHWGIRCTDDFGRLVFILVESGVLRKSDEDRLDDFANVFDFDEAFDDAEACGAE